MDAQNVKPIWPGNMNNDRFNHIIRDKIESLDKTVPPEVKWYPEKSWTRLEQKLKPQSSRISSQGDIKTYSHYYAAASIAFLLTFSWIANQQGWEKTWNGEFYNTSVNNNDKQETSLLKMKPAAKIIEVSEPGLFYHRISKSSALIRPKNLTNYSIVSSNTPNLSKSIEMVPRLTIGNRNPMIKLGIPVYLNWSNHQLGPGFGLRTGLIIPRTDDKSITFALIAQTNFLVSRSEGKSLKVAPQTFLNLEFIHTKYSTTKKQRSWHVGSGLLVLDPENIYQKPTFKFFAGIGINKFKISPELIISDKFKNIIPGLTISYG